MSVSYEEAFSRLNYDPESGEFSWKTHKNKQKIGKNAVSAMTNGYPTISMKYLCTETNKIIGRTLLAQKLAWLLYYKEHPNRRARISQIDGDRTNLKISNLRALTFEEKQAPSYRKTLTKERADEVFTYDKATGKIYWKVQLNARGPIGSIAGTAREDNYRSIKVDGFSYLTHRVVWLLETGSFPKDGLCIDHINGDPSDNRFENLRVVTYMENSHNRDIRNKRAGKSRLGVYKVSNKFGAQISVNYTSIYLGLFDTHEAASRAYWEAKEQYFPGLVQNAVQ